MTNIIKVLVIEDEPRNVELFEEFLSKEGLNKFILTHSDTLASALVELQNKKFDVILLDLVLPNGSGLEVFHKVFCESKNTPIVVTAVDEDKHTAIEAVKNGAQDYLIKINLTAPLLRKSLRYAIERKKLEICKIEKERRLKRIIESTKAAIYELDFINDRFTYVNTVTCELTGYTKEEFYSMGTADILTPGSLEKWKKRYKDICDGAESIPGEYEIIKKDKTTAWALISSEYKKDILGNVIGANVVAMEITDKKKSENELKKYHERLSLALQATADGIWDWTPDYMYYSPRWETLLDYEPGTISQTVEGGLNLLHPEDRPKVQQCFEDMIEGKKNTLFFEFRMRCKNGNYKWLLSKGKIIEKHDDGTARRIIGTHTDINQRKMAETEIGRQLEKHIDEWSESNKVFNEQQKIKLDAAIEGFCDQHKRQGQGVCSKNDDE